MRKWEETEKQDAGRQWVESGKSGGRDGEMLGKKNPKDEGQRKNK